MTCSVAQTVNIELTPSDAAGPTRQDSAWLVISPERGQKETALGSPTSQDVTNDRPDPEQGDEDPPWTLDG
jgi:hypothetical protein